MTRPPNPSTACFGVACAPHAQCARYHAVEHPEKWLDTLNPRVIDSCETRDHTRPMFILLPTAPRPVAAADSEGGETD